MPCVDGLAALQKLDTAVSQANAALSVLTDNNKTLAAAQASLRTDYMAMIKAKADFVKRKDVLQIVRLDVPTNTLYQDFNLGTDRKATVTGTLACVSSIDGKPTTDAINYTILYQDVPRLTLSTGLLPTFQPKNVYGVQSSPTDLISTPPAAGTTPPTSALSTPNGVVALTGSGRAQVFPMAFVNYRVGTYRSYISFASGRTGEDEFIVTAGLSAGFGVNPNSGTNQPEFFTGLAIGFNRVFIHTGIHWGRSETPGNGFYVGQSVPSGMMLPLNWSYHAKFSIGFSARVAPF